MRQNKHSIFWILAILVVVIIVIVLIINSNRHTAKYDGKDLEEREFVTEYKNKTKGKIQTITSISDIELVRVCMQKFYTHYALLYDEGIINAGDKVEYNLDFYKQEMFDLLSDTYKSKYGITSQNVNEKLQESKYDTVEIYKTYYVTNFEGTNVYFVRGLLRNSQTLESKSFENTLYIDNNTQAYTVSLENDLEKNISELEIGEEVAYVVPSSIEQKRANKYTYPSTSYEEFGNRVFDNVRMLLLKNQDLAYELLSKEGKEKFANKEAITQFVNDNRRDIFLLTFGVYETKLIDNTFVMKIYDSNSKFTITLYFDSFSTFTYDISKV